MYSYCIKQGLNEKLSQLTVSPHFLVKNIPQRQEVTTTKVVLLFIFKRKKLRAVSF